MFNWSWIRKLFTRPSRTVRKAPARFRPRLEAMEDRVTPATFTVTNNLDTASPGSLRWAINQANTNPGADIITIDATLIGGTINATQVGDNLIGPAAFAITGDVTINGPSASSGGITFGRDSVAPLMRLFTVYSGVALTLNNLTVTGGVARGGDGFIGGGGGAGMGGAIFNHGGILRLNNVTLANNAAIGGRGGSSVPNNQQAGGGSGGGPNGGAGGQQHGFNPEYNAAITSDSGSNGGFGGGGGGAGNAVGIFGLGIGNGGNGGFGGGGGTPSWTYRSFVSPINNQTIHINNFSTPGQSGFGAGQSGYSDNASGPGATWSGGGAGMGGAIFSYNGETILNGTTLSGNSATGGGSSPSFNTLTDRVGEGMGGAVFVYNGSFQATNSTISENAAWSGFDAQQGLTDFSRGRSSGGGVYNLNGSAVFSNSTVAANRAAHASAIDNVGWTAGRRATIALDNTLVAEAPSITVQSGRLTLTFTFGPAVALDTLAGGSSTATARNSLATSVTAPVPGLTIVSDLMLGPLQDNGGPTQTMALLVGSPAIDAGDNSAIAPGVTTDQRGLARISGSAVDIGAFEVQQNVPPTIARDQAAVTSNEGTQARNTGTFDDAQGRGTVTLTASLGTVTKNDEAGTWSWSYTPPDGPNGPTTVTITATDAGGLWASTTFFLTVVNVAPTIAISGAASVNEGATYTLTLGAVNDPGQDTVTQYRVHWGDGTSDTYTTAGAKTHTYADGPATRAITVDLVDEDGTHTNRANALSVTVNNVAPTITTFTVPATGTEGSPINLSAAATDPAGALDPLTFTWTITRPDGSTVTLSGSAVSFTPADDGSYGVSLTVSDDDGGSDTRSAIIAVANVAPTIAISGAASVNEGATYTLTLGAVTDPGQDTVTQYRVHWGDGTSDTYTTAGAKTHTYADGPATRAITVDLVDEDGTHTNRANALSVTVNNVAPTVTLTGPPTGSIYAIGTPVTFTGQFTDPGTLDTHTAQWMFDTTAVDGTVSQSNGSGSVSATYTFSAPGVYAMKLIVRDKDNGEGVADTVGGLTALVIIYDPSAGFVTGGGWINSPAGAYAADPSLTGKANFGFVSKYHNGNTVPSGNTEFQLKVADFNFKSTAYEWLVVSGAKARFRGTGTVNGVSGYGFELTAWDGQVNGGGGTDRFRIKIWDRNQGNGIVYDNQMGVADGADPTTALGGGSIVIHRQGQPLMAANGPTAAPPAATPLTDAALRPIVNAAIDRWTAAGLDAASLSKLRSAVVIITDLGGSYLGMAYPELDLIQIDDDAVGHGWFVDPTPLDDSEFATPGDQGEQGRADLVSVVAHELGHLLGLDDLAGPKYEDAVMGEALTTGTRRAPAPADVSAATVRADRTSRPSAERQGSARELLDLLWMSGPLIGGRGRDLFIGGAGANTLNADAGDGLLLAGTTAFDGNQQSALSTVLTTLMYRGNLNYSGADTLNIGISDGSLSTGGSVAITVKSAAEQAADLQAPVEALRVAGVLSKPQANTLIKDLDLKGTNGDSNKVQQFLTEVTSLYNAGILTQEQADALLGPGNILLLSVSRR